MSPRKPQSESDGFLSRLASKVTVPQAAGLAFIASMANADVRSEVMNTLMPQAHGATIGAPSGLDSDYGTSYTPDGGVGCLIGLIPHVMTGSLGFRGDVCDETLQQSSNGNDFTNIKSDVLSAIASAGFTADGTYLAPCDYSDSFDELMVNDLLSAKIFVIEGLSTGGATGVKELQGTAYGCGSVDETYGTYHVPSDTRGVVEIHEFTESAPPTPVYNYGTDQIGNTSVSLALDMAVFTNADDGYSTSLVENMSSGSSATVTPFGVTGATLGLFEAHETGDNPMVVLGDSATLQYLEITGTTVTDPDADLDGYTVTAGRDCNDADAAINPGAAEMCDSVDNNCDGSTDSSDAADATTWYRDHDRDGVGGAVTEVACEQPDGYVPVGGDYDDNDPLVQNPPGACEDGEESADGSFEVGEVICAPMGSATVYGGEVEYYSDVDAAETADAGDWLEIVGTLGLDSSSYQTTYTVTPSEDFRGGFGLGILDDAIMRSPPPATGSTNFLAIRVDAGTVILYNTETKTSEVLGPGYHTVATEDLVVDTGDTGPGDTDTGSGDDTDDSNDTGPVIDSGDSVDSGDSESGDDTGGNEDTGDGDGGCKGCQSCGITPMPDSSIAVFGLAMAGGLALRRRRR